MMRMILGRKFKKKNKLNISINWLTYEGQVNFNQSGQPQNIKVFKNEFFGREFSKDKLKFSSEVLSEFDENKNLAMVNSAKIREMELEHLLHKILEKNRIRNNNNKFVVESQGNTQELYDNMLISVVKQHINKCRYK